MSLYSSRLFCDHLRVLQIRARLPVLYLSVGVCVCRGLKNLLGALARGHVLLFVVVDLVLAASGGGDKRERTHFFYILGMCVCVFVFM